MKFSIIIPTYNAEKTIKACLDSICNQTYSDFEVIIIDDGSSDSTPDICRHYADTDARFSLIEQTNHGVSYTRNLGISKAHGEFIVFIDSDDSYCENYLSEFSYLILNNPEHDNFWCCYSTVYVNIQKISNNLLANAENDIYRTDRSHIMDMHEAVLDAALWNKAFRRELVLKYNLKMNEDLSLGEDLLFNFQYLDIARPQIAIINKPLYLYRKAEDGTLDSKYRADLKEIYELIDTTILQYLKKWNVAESQMKKYYNSVFYSQVRILYNTYHKNNTLSNNKKLKYNRKILHSKKFADALSNSDCYINPLYRFGYSVRSWILIRMLDFLVNIKSKLLNR